MGVNMVLCELHVLFRFGILFIHECPDKDSPYVVVLNQHINTSNFRVGCVAYLEIARMNGENLT